MKVSIVIPTYGRERVLLETISSLLDLEHPADEIILVDQTPVHDSETEVRLQAWDSKGSIRWLRRSKPSITEAMNQGLMESKSPLVLFVDDDIVPSSGLVSSHVRAHITHPDCWASVGQVIQPWQKAEAVEPIRKQTGLESDFDFPFHSSVDSDTTNVMAGNLCVVRERALAAGGFDENFIGPAYRFETDFARRIIQSGGRIRFVGSAGLHHLRADSGGTRIYGNHLTSASPVHGFGDYYYAFLHGSGVEASSYSIKRMFREVRTRFHLVHPWWIPLKLLGEIRAFSLGRKQARKGRKLLSTGRSA